MFSEARQKDVINTVIVCPPSVPLLNFLHFDLRWIIRLSGHNDQNPTYSVKGKIIGPPRSTRAHICLFCVIKNFEYGFVVPGALSGVGCTNWGATRGL